MVHGRKWTGLSLVAGAAAVTGLLAGPAQAQNDVPPVNQGNVNLEIGADVASEYIFRGVIQQNKGFIFQPYATVSAELPEFGGLQSDLYFGTWNSFHDRGSSKWYEADFFVGVATEVYDNVVLDVGYVTYRDPVDDETDSSEVQVAVAFDDSELMDLYGGYALNPRAMVAVETTGPLYGDDKGVYGELGVEPTFPITPEDSDYPLTLSVPATLGINIKDYHQVDDSNHCFSFFDIGAELTMPLAFIPREYGNWAASAGVHAQWSGRNVRRLNDSMGFGNEVFNTYGTVGVSMTY